MTVEYFAVKVFFREVAGDRQLWVAKSSHHSIYCVEVDRAGFSLPVWSSSERVVDFLRNARLVGPRYEPHAVSLEVFSTAWLSDRAKAIVELQINPDGKSPRALVMSPDEFRATQG